MKDPSNILSQFQSGDVGERRRALLNAASELDWLTADRAEIELADRTASIHYEPAGDLRFAVSLDESMIDPCMALELSRRLPGNLRYARIQNQHQLVADLPSDTSADSINRYVEAAEAACLGEVSEADHGDWEPETASQLLRALGGDDDPLVETDDGWECRPRVGGHPVAVRINLHEGRLHCWRTVLRLPAQQSGNHESAVGLEALRFNGQIKHARFSRDGDHWVAEAWLVDGTGDRRMLADAVRAVAVAERRAHPALTILATDHQVAAAYAGLFDCCDPKPATC